MLRVQKLLGIALAASLSVIAQAQPTAAPAKPAIAGTWSNPEGSVRVSVDSCGKFICGWVVDANAEAQKDARDGGTAQLIGTKLLENYRQTAPNSWQGRVFVPDMGGSYYSTIWQLNANKIKISGCILGGWICKSQIWHRA